MSNKNLCFSFPLIFFLNLKVLHCTHYAVQFITDLFQFPLFYILQLINWVIFSFISHQFRYLLTFIYKCAFKPWNFHRFYTKMKLLNYYRIFFQIPRKFHDPDGDMFFSYWVDVKKVLEYLASIIESYSFSGPANFNLKNEWVK